MEFLGLQIFEALDLDQDGELSLLDIKLLQEDNSVSLETPVLKSPTCFREHLDFLFPSMPVSLTE